MRIASATSAFPKHYYSQKVLLERLQDYWGDRLKNPLLLARLHRNVTVDGRYLLNALASYYTIPYFDIGVLDSPIAKRGCVPRSSSTTS